MWVRLSPASTSEVHQLEKTHKGKNLQRLTFNSRILRLKAQRQRSPQWAAHVWGNLVEESQLK